MEKVDIRSEPIELMKLLKYANIVQSGGEAKHVIKDGLVMVNGVVETALRKKIRFGDIIAFEDQQFLVVKDEEESM